MGISAILKTLTATRTATAEALRVIDQLREEISSVKDEIATLEAAPQPVATALAAFDAWAARTAAVGLSAMPFGIFLDPAEANIGPALPHHTIRVGDGIVRDYDHATRALLGLLLASNLPAMRMLVAEQLATAVDGMETVTPEARAKKLKAAAARLLEAEMAEESAIRQLERAGVSIDRRPDASALALLASDDALPG